MMLLIIALKVYSTHAVEQYLLRFKTPFQTPRHSLWPTAYSSQGLLELT